MRKVVETTEKTRECTTEDFELQMENIWEPWKLSSQESEKIELLFQKDWASDLGAEYEGPATCSSGSKNEKEMSDVS